MEFLEIALPVTLLFLAFLLKLLIDRATTAPVFIQSLFELPVDIAFLAMSFVIAFTINAGDKAAEGLFYFVVYVVCSIIIVFLWRRSTLLFESNSYFWAGSLASINYAISVVGIYLAIGMVKGVAQ